MAYSGSTLMHLLAAGVVPSSHVSFQINRDAPVPRDGIVSLAADQRASGMPQTQAAYEGSGTMGHATETPAASPDRQSDLFKLGQTHETYFNTNSNFGVHDRQRRCRTRVSTRTIPHWRTGRYGLRTNSSRKSSTTASRAKWRMG